MSSNDVTIRNALPAEIVALQHSTLDEAITLCERAHAIAIPAATIDEAGCRAALIEANRLYEAINGLAKQLEAARLERGREISALKAQLDDAVKAATGPLNDQRGRLGLKLVAAQRELDRVLDQKRRAAEAERLRLEAEQRAIAEASLKAQRDAAAAAAAAAEAARRAADVSALTGQDPLPDDPTVIAAAKAAETAAAAATAATEAHAAAVDRVFDATPAPYVAPAPKSAVKIRTDYSLQVDNLLAVPRDAGGVPLWKLDEAAALKLLRAGVKITGLSLVAIETTAAKGRSNAFAV